MTDIILYKIVCFTDPDHPGESFSVGDPVDPALECRVCSAKHSHVHNFNDKTHHIFKIGSVTYRELVELINHKDQKPRRIV